MFPSTFIWGAGSSSYQIEGGAQVDGRGPSIWDTFCQRPGAVHHGETGGVACDHYHRMQSDVALMRTMGLRAYRFSVAWPRVLPEGTGSVSAAGLGFYDRLVDELLSVGIEPWVTLYHWDLPQALFDRGGWLNPEIPRWFADYTAAVVDRLSDRVGHWITINEPQIFIGLGYNEGKHAPGLKLATAEQLRAAHQALLAHGRAVQVIRGRAKTTPRVGWAPIGRVEYPAEETPEEIEAARRLTFAITEKGFWNNAWFGDPACLGRYPEDALRLYGADAPTVAPGEMETIHQPLDFYGVNIYSGTAVRRSADGTAKHVPWPAGTPASTLRWPVAPKSLYWGPRFLAERYQLPIVVTENGMAGLDWVQSDGRIRDYHRIDYTRQYLLELARAVRDGVRIDGYFHWSIMDNFEWAEGYKERFGMIHVDYTTQQRTLKDSAYWYREVIRTGGGHLRESAPIHQVLAAQAAERTAAPVIVEASPAGRPARTGRVTAGAKLAPALLGATLLAGLAGPTAPARADDPLVPGWQLTWSDEFDGPTIDGSKWRREEAALVKNNEQQYYDADNVYIQNGMAVIKAERRAQGGRPYTSGLFESVNRFSQAFGRFEARMKLPKTQGMWPAFWMLRQAGGWPPEIDIMELLGHEPNKVYMTNHWGTWPNVASQGSSYIETVLPDYASDFHTFAVEWWPNRLEFYVDGVRRGTHTGGLPQDAFYIIINTAVGGIWPGYPDATTVFPQYMYTDWVRVYQPLMNNASFESLGTGSAQLYGWVQVGRRALDTTTGRTGPSSAKLWGNFTTPNNTSYLYQDVPVTPGTRYRLQAHWLNPAGDALAAGNFTSTILEFRNSSNVVVGYGSDVGVSAGDPTNQWFASSVAGVAPPTAVTARLRLNFTQPNLGAGSARVDDVDFRPAPCPADLNGDGFVDDSDFVDFALAYDAFVCAGACPADLNNDGFVDDTDFVIFAHAYDDFSCP